MYITSVNNKPITKDTATADILAIYAAWHYAIITASRLRRGSDGIYTWFLRVGNHPPFKMSVSETRRRCLDNSLMQYAKDK